MALTDEGRRKLSSSMKKRWAARRSEKTVLSSSSAAKRQITSSLKERRDAILNAGKEAQVLISNAERERTIKHILDLADHLDHDGKVQAMTQLMERLKEKVA